MTKDHKIVIGDGDTEITVAISGYTDVEREQILRAMRNIPDELRRKPMLLAELMNEAALQLRRDGQISVEGTVNVRAAVTPTETPGNGQES